MRDAGRVGLELSAGRALRVAGVLLGVAGLGWFAHLAWRTRVWESLAALTPALWLVVPLAAGPATCYTLSLRRAFPRLPGSRTPSFGALFALRLAGEAINNGLASAYVAGEPVKGLLAARHGATPAAGMAAALVGKTTFLLGEVLFLVVGVGAAAAWFGAGSPVVAMLAWVTAAGLAAVTVGVLLQQRRLLGRGARLLSAVRLGPRRLWARALPGADAVDAAARGYYAAQRADFWRSTLWAAAGWTLGTLEVWLFLRLAAPVERPVLFALAAEAAIQVVKGLAFAVPGGIGVQEGGIAWLFRAGGVGEDAAVTYAVLRRFRETAWVGLGFLCLAAGLRGAAPAPPAVGKPDASE